MKRTIIKFIIPVIAVLFIVNCSTSNNKQEGTQKTMETKEKTITPLETANPHYIISVTSGKTKLGDIEVELFPAIAPKHVHNFDSLVSIKFFDGTAFHRVIPGFMIQGGDPNTKDDSKKDMWGMGQPSQTRVPAEFNSTKHVRGILSAARSQDPNSATSQFFIMHGNAPHLDGQYTAYGQVVSGIEVVDKVCTQTLEGPQKSSPVTKITMKIVKK